MRKLAKKIPALVLVLLLLFGGSVIAYADGPLDNDPDLTDAQPLAFNTVVSGSLEKQKNDHHGQPYYYAAYELQAPESGYYRFSSTGGHWSADDDFHLWFDMYDAAGSFLFDPEYHGRPATAGDFLFSFYLEKETTCYMLICAGQPGDFTVYAEPFDACVKLKSSSITLGYKQVLDMKKLLEGSGYTADDLDGYGTSGDSYGPNPIDNFYSSYSQSIIAYGAARGTVKLRLDLQDASFAEIEVTVQYSAWNQVCYKYLFGWLWMNWKKPLTNLLDLYILYKK